MFNQNFGRSGSHITSTWARSTWVSTTMSDERMTSSESGSECDSGHLSIPTHMDNQFLTCEICQQIYCNPKLLPCMHSFCERCLLTYVPAQSITLTCPVCGQQSILPKAGVSALQDNHFVNHLMDTLSEHHDEPTVELMSIVTPESHLAGSSTGLMCPNHTAQTLRFYCRQCETAICTTCTDIEHSSHKTMRLTDAVHDQKRALRMLLNKTYSYVPDLQETIESIDETSSSLQANYDEARSQLIESFDRMIGTLEDRKLCLLERLDEMLSYKQQTLSDQRRVIQSVLQNISNTCDLTEGTLEHGTDTEVLLVTKQMSEKLSAHQVTGDVPTKPGENDYVQYVDDGVTEICRKLAGLADVCSSSAVAYATSSAGDGLKQCIVSKETVVTVATKDRHGNLVRVQPSLFKTSITGPSFEKDKSCVPEVVDQRDGTYDVVYCLNKEGNHELEIQLFGQHVKGSPFQIRAIAEEETSSNDRPIGSKIPRTTAVRQRVNKRPPSHRSSGGSNRKSNPIEDDLLAKIGCKGRCKGEFSNPQGVCSNNGKIIVADSNNQCVQVFENTGPFKLRFGIRGRGAGQLQRPTGVAVMPNGNFVVADYENKCVSIFENNGKFVNRIGMGKLLGPKGICVNRDGHIIVVDNKGSSIFVFQSNGKLIHKFGNRGMENQNFAGPHFVAVNEENQIIVSDFHNHKIKIFNSDGTYISSFGSNGEGNGQFNAPTGIAVDKTGNILVADWGNSRIQVFDEHGSFLSFVNTAANPLYGPQGLALTDEGLVVVADSGNHCLKVYRYLQ